MQESRTPHPEYALGIPLRVICAKPLAKAHAAELCDYAGPLTLQAAVESGHTTQDWAIGLLRRWVASGGRLQDAQEMWPGFTMPEQVTIFGKERQYRDD